MKKQLLITITIFFNFILFAQDNVRTYYEQIQDGYILYIDNNEHCSVSLEVNFELRNLKSSDENKNIFLIPANVKKFQLAQLKIIKPNKKYGFNYKTRVFYGDINNLNYDSEFQYHLPYEKDLSYKVIQGNNGTFSHSNKNAIDFSMPVGTKITAARGGVVIKVIEKNNRGCADQKCEKYNNKILIYHNDGTIGKYLHLKQNSINVKVGDKVKIGDIIAESGNTGWSSVPHLHFEVFKSTLKKTITIETKFKVDDNIQILEERKAYLKSY